MIKGESEEKKNPENKIQRAYLLVYILVWENFIDI